MRDPSRSWRDALAGAWERGEAYSLRVDGFMFAWVGSAFAVAMIAILSYAPDLSQWPAIISCGVVELGWYIGWAAWTKPRLPTIWEALAGQLITLGLPIVHACRWFGEFGDAQSLPKRPRGPE